MRAAIDWIATGFAFGLLFAVTSWIDEREHEHQRNHQKTCSKPTDGWRLSAVNHGDGDPVCEYSKAIGWGMAAK